MYDAYLEGQRVDKGSERDAVVPRCLQEFGAYQFTAFYLTAGIASSMVAYLGRLARPTGGRSLGASGAVIACFAATALRHPGVLVVQYCSKCLYQSWALHNCVHYHPSLERQVK